MMNKFKSVLLLVSVTILIACKGKPNNIYNRNNSVVKTKIYATDALSFARDIPMKANAAYDDGTLFYGRSRKYYKLSDSEINTIKKILYDRGKWLFLGAKSPFLDISKYYRQYLAYKKGRDVFVLVNLFKYYYIVVARNDVVGSYAPAKRVHIITLPKDKSKNKYDNVTILLNLSKKRIIDVHHE